MKKTILIPLTVLVLCLAGCVQQTPSQNDSLNLPATNENQTDNQNLNIEEQPAATTTVKLLSPNGGERFTLGADGITEAIPVNWESGNVSAGDGINLVIIDSAGKEIIETSILGDINGPHSWTAALTPGQYKLKVQVCEIAGPIEARCGEVLAEDVSDGAFTIAEPADETADWQTYSDSKFSYQCPEDWKLGKNLNYNGQVNTSECVKIYSGTMSFDDGVSLTFGFVPQTVADSYEWAGEKWADTLINEVKNEDNAQTYKNNNFSGWLSMRNQKHALDLIARYQVNDGYYEVTAKAAGETKTDAEFKQIVDQIISTFSVK